MKSKIVGGSRGGSEGMKSGKAPGGDGFAVECLKKCVMAS